MSVTAAQSTKTNLAKLYKDLFPDRRLKQVALLDKPFLNWLPKADDLEGTGIWIPYKVGAPQGFSSQFYSGTAGSAGLGAQNNVSSGTATRAFIEAKDYYGVVSIDSKSMRQARSNMGAFVRIKETEVEELTKMLSQELAIHLWKDGTGVIGRAASVSGEVITLTNPADAVNFQPKQTLQASATVSGGTLLGSTAGYPGVVEKVDFDAGTVTLVSGGAASCGVTTNSYLFNRGNYATSSSALKMVTGVAKWIPTTAETSGTFLSMDRTSHVQYLQGHRQTFTGSLEETIKKLLTKMSRVGARPDAGWVSFNTWLKLEMELQGRAYREDAKDSPFGLSSLVYGGPGGNIRFMADPFIPDSAGYLLRRDSWMLHHLDGLPHLITDDGNAATRGQDYDGLEMRVRMWMELACTQPKDNGTFATA
jgi:hypothetical protein